MTTFLLILVGLSFSTTPASQEATLSIALPKPDNSQGMPLNLALDTRRSHRRFSSEPISLSQLSQLLWSAQGKTHFFGFRTAPSAGARYPLEIYAVVSQVEQLEPGIYHYEPASHRLEMMVTGELRKQLARAADNQGSITRAAVTLVISGVIQRSAKKYGPRATRYVHIETGTVAQNIYLQATSLHLATVFVGSFKDAEVKQVMHLPQDHEPFGLMPVGHH